MSTFITLPAVAPFQTAREGNQPPRERIVGIITDWIADGILPPGFRLPPVREAAEHFHVEKGTIVRAYKLLIERRLVISVGRSTRAALIIPGQTNAGTLARTLLVLTSFRGVDVAATANGAGGWSAAILGGIFAAAHDAGWSVFLQHEEAPSASGPLPIAAIAVHPSPTTHEHLAHLCAAGVPVAVYGDVIDDPSCDRVACDHAAGARMLVEHLVARGRKRIRIQLPKQDFPWAKRRYDGWRSTLIAAGLPVAPVLHLAIPDLASRTLQDLDLRARIVAGHLAEHVTGSDAADAILAASDGDALVMGVAVRLFHLRVHADVAICGFDGYGAHAYESELGAPLPYATINKDNALIGRKLVELVLNRSRGETTVTPREILLQPRLEPQISTSM